MASLYVTEYPEIGIQSGTAVPVAFVPSTGPIAEQKIAIAAGSNASSAFNTNTRAVRLHCDAICSVRFGNVVVIASATSSDPRFAANQTEYFAVQPDGIQGVSVITNT